MTLDIGTLAPQFTLTDQNKNEVSLSDLLGRKSMIVFIPFPNTGICDAEACEIRDNWNALEGLDAGVVIINCHAVANNKMWAETHGLHFPVLSDFWPHGAVSRAYDSFDAQRGYSKRTTYFLDAEGVIRDVVASDVLGEARPFSAYPDALASY